MHSDPTNSLNHEKPQKIEDAVVGRGSRGGSAIVTCTFCGNEFARYKSHLVAPNGKPRKIFKCPDCRSAPIEKRFWCKVDRAGGEGACWLWRGGLNADGYGHFPHRFEWGLEQRSNRIAWILTNGKIPQGQYVLHCCPKGHNRACCNPKHLYIGNQTDNMKDLVESGKKVVMRGEENSIAILNDDAVREIRREYGSYGSGPMLSKKFGVDITTIRDVAKRRSWKHVK